MDLFTDDRKCHEDTQVDLKDDFYTAVNKERILQDENGLYAMTFFDERSIEIEDQIRSLIMDEALGTPEMKAVREFYNDYIDMGKAATLSEWNLSCRSLRK